MIDFVNTRKKLGNLLALYKNTKGVRVFMKIETKYNIGDRIWVVYENQGEVSVYDDTILEIVINENGIAYIVDGASIDRDEEDIILYDDKASLVNKIIETMNEIHKKEEFEGV